MKTIVSWSSGKDSAWMVHVLRQQPEYELAGILTTVTEQHQRVAMHAVRVELLEAQADGLGLPQSKRKEVTDDHLAHPQFSVSRLSLGA